MEHTQIVTTADLENYANTRGSESVIPELVCLLIKESVSDLTNCRIPSGDGVSQPGLDGLVATEIVFRQFVPKKELLRKKAFTVLPGQYVSLQKVMSNTRNGRLGAMISKIEDVKLIGQGC